MKKIIVKKVNIQQDEVDRLNNTIEMRDNTIKYQQDQYLKLLRKLDNQEPYGLNCLLFTYTEIIEILKSQYHPMKDYLERWFGTYLDYEENDYWLVNVKTDYACTLKKLDRLNRKVYELESGNNE